MAEILERVDRLRQAEPPPRLKEILRSCPGLAAAGDVRHVVLTGGEPMLCAELGPLSAVLRRRLAHHDRNLGHRLPAGRLRFDVDQSQAFQLRAAAGMAPQWTELHAQQRHAPEVIRRLAVEYDCQTEIRR